jgi:hypothetical protein
MRKFISAILVPVIFLSGCATASNNITASYVSPMQYNSYSCEQLQAEMIRLNNRIREVAGIQDRKAGSDKWAMGIGLVLFWPALFFMMGPDKREEIARLKGEYEAVEQAGIQKNCGFVVEMEKARQEAQGKTTTPTTKPTTTQKTEPKKNFGP